jgi:hypothetical protein
MVDRGTLDMMRHHDFIDPRVRSQAPDEKMAPLSPAFNPGNWDVISMMGRESYEHGKRKILLRIMLTSDKLLIASDLFSWKQAIPNLY